MLKDHSTVDYLRLSRFIEEYPIRGGYGMFEGEIDFFEEKVAAYESDKKITDIHIDKSVTDRISKSSEESRNNIFNPATFRDFVLAGYGNACAITGQLAEGNFEVGVDVVYIKPKAEGGSCFPNNGIALSKQLSLAFVRGEFTLSERFEVITHPDSDNELLKYYHLKQIRVPQNKFFQPAEENLVYHRQMVYGSFKKRRECEINECN